jgi:hypothetical protein
MEKDSRTLRQNQGKAKHAYIQVSLSLLRAGISDRAKVISLALIECANRKGHARVAISYLAERVNSSEDKAQKAVLELEAKGLITILRTGRKSEYFLSGLLDVYLDPEVTASENEQAIRTARSEKARKNKARKEEVIPLNLGNRNREISGSDTAEPRVLLIHNSEINNSFIHTPSNLSEVEGLKANDDEVSSSQSYVYETPETLLRESFEEWLKEALDRSSRIASTVVRLSRSSEKHSNSFEALEKFYLQGGTPLEVETRVKKFLFEYPSKIANRGALVASSFEAILDLTPEVDTALETPPLWVSKVDVLLDEPSEPRELTQEELEAQKQAREAEREAQAERAFYQAFKAFQEVVQRVRPDTSEEEVLALFEGIEKPLWRKALFTHSRDPEALARFLESELTKLKERVN